MVASLHAGAQFQYQVKKANGKNILPGQTGIYYSLPKTIFKIQLIFEKITKVPGPYSNFAQQFLGTDNYIKQKKSYYKLLAVKVNSVTVADQNQRYFISFPLARQSKNPKISVFQLNKEGILTSFGIKPLSKKIEKNAKEKETQLLIYSNQGSSENFEMSASFNKVKKIDTLIRKITIDTVTIKRFLFRTSWVKLSPQEQAEDAAKQINKIRNSRYNLLTGYQEVNYGNGIKYMDQELQKLEQQYLVLFLGKETKEIVMRNFDFDPEKNSLSTTLMQYIGSDGHSRNITFKVNAVNAPSNISSAPKMLVNALFYRIPAKAYIRIFNGGTSFYSDVYEVPQLGAISTATMSDSRLELNPGTGALTRLIHE